jgi:hypothetical protein
VRVVYRKGELSKGTVDSGWPHQVALPAKLVSAQYYEILGFCRAEGLSLCVRGHSFQRDRRDYVVKCFATKEDADKLIARFGGEYMTPATRPRF